jgi:S-formylglutathione hydrolase FrmB
MADEDRSLRHLVNLLADLEALGISFVSLGDNLDLTTSSGQLMFHVIAAMAQFERSLIQERVKAGLRNAREKGRRLGRPPKDLGLSGHSMGGYGTIRIGMKYPDAFSSLYAMSACCLAPNPNLTGPAMDKALAIQSAADLAKADFGTRAIIASAAAWSPDPKNPPRYIDLPVADGKVVPSIAARWDANAPLAMLDQYVINLKEIRAIALDAGTKDPLLASIQDLDGRLTLFGVLHTFETYDGTHISGIQDRLEKNVIPFFSANLSFANAKK